MTGDPGGVWLPVVAELVAAAAALPADSRGGMAVVFAEYAASYVGDQPELARVYAALCVLFAGAAELRDAYGLQAAVRAVGDGLGPSVN